MVDLIANFFQGQTIQVIGGAAMAGSGMAGIFYYPFVLEVDKVHLLLETYLLFFGVVILFLAGPCRSAQLSRLVNDFINPVA